MKRFITNSTYKILNGFTLRTIVHDEVDNLWDRTGYYGFLMSILKVSICCDMDKIYDLFGTDLDLRMEYYL